MMHSSLFMIALVPALAAATPLSPSVKPFKIDLSDRVPHMLDLIRRTQLPLTEVPAGKESMNSSLSSGISLSTLKSMKEDWITRFDWNKEQATMNKRKHYITTIEGLKIHFIHEKSNAPNAIPIILLHGWPGSFLEVEPLIDMLTVRSTGSNNTSFNVIIPSLPGYGLSSPAPDGWTIKDTARIFDHLVHSVLGYKKYAVHGTDWGSGIAYNLYNVYNITVRAAHLNFLPFYPLNFNQLADLNISISPEETLAEQRAIDWQISGNGYFVEQTTKPNTIGLSLFDNPVGQLAWIGEKMILWSDPRQGTGPSLLNHHEILRHVSLYYLSQTFISSVYTYYQNQAGFSTEYTKANTDAPLLYSTFSYNVGFWPKALVAKVGHLVSYKYHDFGGHFPALDNPVALAEDIRDIEKFWQTT